MKGLAVLLAAAVLAGCQTTGIRGDLSAVKGPAAMQIGHDSAEFFRDQFAVDSAVWHVANEGKTTVRSAVAQGLREAGYEVVETFNATTDTPNEANTIAVSSVDNGGLVVVTIAVNGELLSRGYEMEGGQPVTAWSRRLP